MARVRTGRVGRVGLVVDRRDGQVGGHQRLAGVDGRLHLFLGHVQAQREAELEHDDRLAAGAGRGHLAQALHLAELALQRRRDRGCHHIGAGAGIEGQHLDGRVVDLRQRGDGQLREGHDPREQNRGHQQRGSDRPQNKWAGRTHGAALPVVSDDAAGSLTLEMEDRRAVHQLFRSCCWPPHRRDSGPAPRCCPVGCQD